MANRISNMVDRDEAAAFAEMMIDLGYTATRHGYRLLRADDAENVDGREQWEEQLDEVEAEAARMEETF